MIENNYYASKAKMDVLDVCYQLMDILSIYVPGDENLIKLKEQIRVVADTESEIFGNCSESDASERSVVNSAAGDSEADLYSAVNSLLIAFSDMEPNHSPMLTKLISEFGTAVLGTRDTQMNDAFGTDGTHKN